MRLLTIIFSVLLFGTSASSQADDSHSPVTGQLSLYVNGALQASTQCPSAWQATGHTQLGRGLFGGNPTDFVTGLLGDARVYDWALSAAQVKALYSQGPQTEWQLDHKAGSAQGMPAQNGPLDLTGPGTSVDIGRSLLDTTRSYTVSVWIELSSTDGFQTFISQDGKSLSGFYLQKRGDDGKFALSIRDSDGPNPPQVIAESSLVPKVNTLYHIVGVFRAGPAAAPPVASPPPVVSLPAVPSPPAVAPFPWDPDHQGRFLESLARDQQGHIWVATEGQGVWRFDSGASGGNQWTQFTAKEGLGDDNVYALLVDAQSRVWAGTVHGVSIYDGKTWKTYGPLEGLGGCRVFALASCPTNGDVWIATEGGLTRYHARDDRWQQYTQSDGLPSDAIQALAFNKAGDLFAGTQSDGIAIASAGDDYRSWRVVRGPASLPGTAGGVGLPSSLINCLYVAQDGTVYAGTTAGLARSSDSGRTWRFLRGADWVDKHIWEQPQIWQDTGLVDQADVRAIEVLPQSGPAVRIAAGGSGEGEWKADHGFLGGQVFHVPYPIDTSAVQNPAPQSVYQSARWGSFFYTVSHLKPGTPCRVRLHFAEVAFDKPGQRVFNVTVNGRRVLTHEDVRAEAEAENKVIVKEFVVPADAQGRLVLAFRGTYPLPLPDKHSPYELAEDYITALAEDGAGHLLVGHRQKGLEMLDTQTGKHVAPIPGGMPSAGFVTALLPRPNGTLLIGGYGIGLSQMPIIGTTTDGVFAQAVKASSQLPTPAAPPTLAELNAMLKSVSAVAPNKNELQPHVAVLQDDWLTQGNWLGRYGRYWACDPACCSPDDYHWGAGWQAVNYSASAGPNRTVDDSLRYWVQTLYTDEPNCLELPPTYLDSRMQKKLTTPDKNRRDSSQDDHGETYPMAMDGPNIYQTIHVPAGLYMLSLYFFNRQYADGPGDRDYRLSVRPQPVKAGSGSISGFSALPEWAHGRVLQHRSGVWKRFLVRGPQALTVEVNRNHSWNTELDGIMLDLLDETPPPYFGTVIEWKNLQMEKEKQRRQRAAQGCLAVYHPAANEGEAADRLLSALGAAQEADSSWWAANGRRFYVPLLRWYTAQPAPKDPLGRIHRASSVGTCDYVLGLYQDWEQCQHKQGLQTARDIEKSLRWDGTSDAGEEYQVVTNSLAIKGDRKVGQRPTEAKYTAEDVSAPQHP